MDNKCPNLKAAVNITTSRDTLILEPGIYEGRENIEICEQIEECPFTDVALMGSGRPEEVIIRGNWSFVTRALYIKNNAMTLVSNITYDGFATPLINHLNGTDSADSNFGDSAIAAETSKVIFQNLIFKNPMQPAASSRYQMQNKHNCKNRASQPAPTNHVCGKFPAGSQPQ